VIALSQKKIFGDSAITKKNFLVIALSPKKLLVQQKKYQLDKIYILNYKI
jgi:hypothetical protein